MPKESTSARTLTGPRQIVKTFEMASMYWNDLGGGSGEWLPSQNVNVGSFANWKTVGNNLPAFYSESYIDLSGYERDDLTVGLRSCYVQDPGVYLFQGADQVYCVYDILSQERLTKGELQRLANNNRVNRQMGPGTPEGPLDRQQIVFGLYRFFSHNTTNIGLPELMVESRAVRFGSGQPTAVQKLWAYRICIMFDTPGNDLVCTLPAAHFVMNAEIFKEAEGPYFMRLKRSYELAMD